MTELTKEQVAMFFSGDYDHLTCKEFRELTPKPKFTKWQVVHHGYLEDDQPTGEYVFVDEPDIYGDSYRSLNQAEVGPDWMPSSEAPGYKIAVGALKKVIAQFDGDTEGYIDISKVREALSRIKELGGMKDGC